MAVMTSVGRRSDLAADRKSTRLNSSHSQISYAVFCLKKKNLLQPRDARGRQARRILAEQRSKRLLEIARRDSLQVKDWDQYLQAAGAPRIGRQDSRR